MDQIRAFIKFLEGKKTYIGGALLIIVAGLRALGHISETEFGIIETALIGMGFITQRMATRKVEKATGDGTAEIKSAIKKID